MSNNEKREAEGLLAELLYMKELAVVNQKYEAAAFLWKQVGELRKGLAEPAIDILSLNPGDVVVMKYGIQSDHARQCAIQGAGHLVDKLRFAGKDNFVLVHGPEVEIAVVPQAAVAVLVRHENGNLVDRDVAEAVARQLRGHGLNTVVCPDSVAVEAMQVSPKTFRYPTAEESARGFVPEPCGVVAAVLPDGTAMHIVVDEAAGVKEELWEAAKNWKPDKVIHAPTEPRDATPLEDIRATAERMSRTVGFSSPDPEVTANILAAMDWAAKTDPPKEDDSPKPDHVIEDHQ